MRRKDPTFNIDDYKIIQELNYDKTTMFVQQLKTSKKYVMKLIDTPTFNPPSSSPIPSSISKLLNNTHQSVLKPQLYCLTNNRLYLLHPKLPISLQKLILVHRSKSTFFSRRIFEQFVQTMYNMVHKLNEQIFYHGNFKPSNVFYKEGAWVVGECGMVSARVCKYYSKGFKTMFDKQGSIEYTLLGQKYGLQRDLYSLGMVMLEMMSLVNIDAVYGLVRGTGKEDRQKLQEMYDGCAKHYGVEAVELAKSMITGNAYKEVYKRWKNYVQQQQGNEGQRQEDECIKIQSYMNAQYSLNLPELQQIYNRIRTTQKDCLSTLQTFHRYDPILTCRLQHLSDLQSLLHQSYNLQFDESKLLSLWQYFTILAQMRFLSILKQIYPIQQLFKAILLLVSRRFDKLRQFFQAFNKNSQYWNVNSFKGFFQQGEMDISVEQIRYVIKLWNKDEKREYLTFGEFSRALGAGMENVSMVSKGSKGEKELKELKESDVKESRVVFENDLTEMLSLLRNRVHNKSLFRFFRDHDPKMMWVCEPNIQRLIRDKVRMPEDKLKRACQCMWSKAGTAAPAGSQKLKYLVLLKDTKMQTPQQLFNSVITQKVNMLDFSYYFSKYQLDDHGWTIQSLLKINDQQMLQFHQRQIKQVFRLIDTNNSKTISQKQLREKLTGIKQFSQSVYVQNLKSKCQQLGLQPINIFLKHDKNSDLLFDSIQQLQSTFSFINIQMSPQHATELFQRYTKRTSFQYVSFLTQIYTPCMQVLFKQIVLYLMQQHYSSDFDKVFQLGRIGQSSKWTEKSLLKLNDEMVLGFTQRDLEGIWVKFDPNEERALSKAEVKRVFGVRFEKGNYQEEEEEEEEEGEEGERERERERERVPQRKVSVEVKQPVVIREVEKEKTLQDRILEEVQQNQILNELLMKSKKRDVIEFFFENDKQQKFSLSLKQFQSALHSLGIQPKKGSILKSTQKFQFKDQDSHQLRINFIKLALFLNTLSQNQASAKSTTLLKLIRHFMQVRKCSVDDLLATGKDKTKWTIKSLQSFLEKSLSSKIYFDDIEIVWEYWNCGVELDRKELQEILRGGTVGKGRENEMERGDRGDRGDRGERRDSRKRGSEEEGQYQRKGSVQAARDILDTNQYRKQSTMNQRNSRPTRQPPSEQQSSPRQSKRYGGPNRPRKPSDGIRQVQSVQNPDSRRQQDPRYRKHSGAIEAVRKGSRDGRQRQRQRQRETQNPSLRKDSQERRMIPGEDLSFMPRQTGEKRKNYDEELVKYSTERSEEIPWGDNNRDNRDTRDKWENNRDNRDKWENKDKWDNKDKWENRDRERSRQKDRQRQRDKQDPTPKTRQPSRTASLRLNLKAKQKQLITQLTQLIDKYGFTDFQKYSLRGTLQPRDFKQLLLTKYKMPRQSVTALLQLVAIDGRVKLTDLKALVPSKSSNEKGRSTPRQVISPLKEQNLSSSQFIPENRRQRMNIPLVREQIRGLVAAFGKRESVHELSNYFFGRADCIDFQRFAEKCEEINNKVPRNVLEQIFSSMHPTRGQVSLINFRISFTPANQQQQPSPLQFPPDLQKQISQVFRKSDKDKSGSIARDQLPALLTSFGVTISAKDLDSYFRLIDTNKSNSIDYSEFKSFIAEKVLPLICNFEEVVDGLRRELRLADVQSRGELTGEQLRAALARLGVVLTEQEVIAIVTEFGREGRVGVGELVGQVGMVAERGQGQGQGQGGVRNDVKMALFKIRFMKKISIKDIKNAFSKLSSCFSIAYSYQIKRNLSLLPSSSLRPKLDPSGLFYSHLFYSNLNKLQPNKPCLQRLQKQNLLTIELRLDQATGIPVPLQTIITRSNILRRHLNISFLDLSQQILKDSMCEVQASWDPQLEDVWKFTNQSGFERSVFVKVGDYEYDRFSSYSILFEFVMTVVDGSSVIEVNCGSANIAVSELTRLDSAVDRRLEVIGGVPMRKKFLKKEDVLARRTGWRKILPNNVESVLLLEAVPHSKFRKQLQKLDILPIRIILNKSSLGLFYYFREYFAQNCVVNGRINTEFVNHYRVKAFLAGMDCREIYREVVPFWNNNIENKVKGLAEGKAVFEGLCEEIYLMICNRDFGYLPSCPTYDSLGNKNLENIRYKIIQSGLEQLLNKFKKLPTKKRQFDVISYDVFRIEQAQQDPQNSIMSILKRRIKS